MGILLSSRAGEERDSKIVGQVLPNRKGTQGLDVEISRKKIEKIVGISFFSKQRAIEDLMHRRPLLLGAFLCSPF